MNIEGMKQQVAELQEGLEVLETARASDPMVTITGLLHEILKELRGINHTASLQFNDMGPGGSGHLGGGGCPR
jgi:hypothetical protein